MALKIIESYKKFAHYNIPMDIFFVLGLIVVFTDIVSKEFNERILVAIIFWGIGTIIPAIKFKRYFHDELLWKKSGSLKVRKFFINYLLASGIGMIVIPLILLLL